MDTHRPDGELLASFAEGADQAAFAELVRRHGPMVLRKVPLAAERRVHAEILDWPDQWQYSRIVFRPASARASPADRDEDNGVTIYD